LSDKTDKKEQYLECGKAVSTHGVKGTLRAECWCDSPAVLASIKTIYTKKNGAYIAHKAEKASVQKQMVLLTLDDIDTLEKAIAMKGTVLYADRDDLKAILGKDAFFISDIIGLPVIDVNSGFVYGKLTNVQHIGAHDIYTIARPAEFREIQPEAMIPAVPEFVKKIDIDSGIFIKPIEGFFEPLTPPDSDGGEKDEK
jgi:16S rRNA processing protein RimM